MRCMSRSVDVWFSSSVDDVVLSYAVHPNLLFAYRLVAFLFAFIVSLVHLRIKGIRPLRFYTKWWSCHEARCVCIERWILGTSGL